MAEKWYFAPLLLLLISGCVTADSESQVAQEQAPFETQASDANYSEPVHDGIKDALVNKAPSKDEIHTIQIRMKMAGVNPGGIDGILGPRTIAALRRFQSGCAMVNDLLSAREAETSQQSDETIKQTMKASQTRRTEDIRALQSRLRSAGFDPGPIDGIMGPKTKSTLSGVQSGCALAKLFTASSNQPIQPVESTFNSKKRLQPAVLCYPAASESGKDSSLTPTMTRTPSQDEIQLIQVRLKEAGFDPGPIDGIMGPKTRTAIQRYRTSKGLTNTPMPSSRIDGMFE